MLFFCFTDSVEIVRKWHDYIKNDYAILNLKSLNLNPTKNTVSMNMVKQASFFMYAPSLIKGHRKSVSCQLVSLGLSLQDYGVESILNRLLLSVVLVVSGRSCSLGGSL